MVVGETAVVAWGINCGSSGSRRGGRVNWGSSNRIGGGNGNSKVPGSSGGIPGRMMG